MYTFLRSWFDFTVFLDEHEPNGHQFLETFVGITKIDRRTLILPFFANDE